MKIVKIFSPSSRDEIIETLSHPDRVNENVKFEKGKLCRRERSSNVKAISSNSKWKRERKAILVICKRRKQTACLSQSQNTFMTSNHIS